MAKARVEISEEMRSKMLLWCERHCCFCGRKCTTNIEIHHIDQNPNNNSFDNLVPLCFDCHGEIERYNPKHPRGSKYRHLEIKTRREQIYEEHTIKYLRKVDIKISKYLHHIEKKERKWPDFSFTVRSLSDDIPLKLRIAINAYLNGKPIKTKLGELYRGLTLWNLNPAQIIFGHFRLPIKKKDIDELRIEVQWGIIDMLEREHKMLPFSYVLTDPNSDFWYDPRTIYANKL